MRYLFVISLLGLMTGTVFAQKKGMYQHVPDSNALVTIASQSNCPLKIEDARILKRIDQPGILIWYRVRNVSKKSIRLISVVAQNSSGSNENFIPDAGPSRVLRPNQTLESARVGIDFEIASDPKPLDSQGPPNKELKTLYIVLVDKILFTDGTVYEDKRTLDALFQFFQDGCNR